MKSTLNKGKISILYVLTLESRIEDCSSKVKWVKICRTYGKGEKRIRVKPISGLLLTLLVVGVFPVVFCIQRVTSEGHVGVKAGDWMEYTFEYIRYTRNPDPPWPRKTRMTLNILSVQGSQMTLNQTTNYSNDTQTTDTMTVNLAIESVYINAGIIPTNLTVGSIFYDENVGAITISGVEERTCAGARRTVVFAHMPIVGDTYYWDKLTGVLVEAHLGQKYYALWMTANHTNIWEAVPTPIWMEGWFWIIIAVVSFWIIIAVFLRKKEKPPIARAKKSSENTSEGKRPLTMSLVAVFTFVLGIIVAALTLMRTGPYAHPILVVYFFIPGLVLASLLTVAGYYLWQRKKWAAKLAVIVCLLDAVTTPFMGLGLILFSFGGGGILERTVTELGICIIVVVGIASAWKDFQ